MNPVPFLRSLNLAQRLVLLALAAVIAYAFTTDIWWISVPAVVLNTIVAYWNSYQRYRIKRDEPAITPEVGMTKAHR